MSIGPPDPDIDPPPPPPGGTPPGQLPGLGVYLRKRYTSNVVVSEQMPAADFLHEVLFPAARLYMTQNELGQISLKNKKPANYAYATQSITSGGAGYWTFDNVEAWISRSDTVLLLFAPHTSNSEVHTLRSARYPSATHNSVGLSSTGGLFTISGFSGCDNSSTPATASITVNSATANTACSITLDGIVFEFTTASSGETTESIASYIAGVIASHPGLYRKFSVVWTSGTSVVYLTARFGEMRISAGETIVTTKAAPVADTFTAPTLTAGGSGSVLAAGDYAVAYAAYNAAGDTLVSNYKTVTLTAGQTITVSAVSLPSGATGLKWYVSPEADSSKIRYHSSNNGSSFVISTLPKLTAALPPDLNRSGCEVMEVKAVFTDRTSNRTLNTASTVLRATFKWFLGNRSDSINRIDLKYRDATQDYRLVELRIRDDAHIEKTKKVSSMEVNGQAIDNTDQAYRIAAGLLAEKRDSDFFYSWKSTRRALLLQEGDVCAITDEGSGVVNLPVMLEEIGFEVPTGSLPQASFTGRKYASNLYDDSIVELTIPVVCEN